MKLCISIKSALLISIFSISTALKAIELPSNISNYIQSKKLSEEETLPLLEADGKTFVEYVVTNKVQILNEFSSVAVNGNQQKMLLAAMEFSSGADYLVVLQKICDLRQTNVIGNEVFEFAIRATPIRKGFLSYNFQNAQVSTVVQRAKLLLPNNSAFQTFLTSVLNGSQKITDKRYFQLNEVPEPELLPPSP